MSPQTIIKHHSTMQLRLINPSDCHDDSPQALLDSGKDSRYVVRVDFFIKAFPLSPDRKEFNMQTLNIVWRYLGEVKHVYYDPDMKFCLLYFKSSVDAGFAVECFSSERSLLALFDTILGPNYGTDYAVLVADVLEEYLVGPTFTPLATFTTVA